MWSDSPVPWVEDDAEAIELAATAPPPPPPPTMPSSPGKSDGQLSPRAKARRELASDGLLTDDEIDIVLKNLEEEERATLFGGALDGVLGKTTWSRYLVENYFGRMRWYHPRRDDPDAPSLSKGWAYFEHFTLPRRFHAKSGGHHTRAPPGEAENTKLYSVLGTPQESLSDWGIGMGMYFSSLSAVIVIFLLAGALSAANMVYYASGTYDPNRDEDSGFQLVDMLRFSAVCTDREWVVCAEGCQENIGYWDSIFTNEFYGTASDANGDEVVLISRTTCLPAQFEQGMINYGTCMLLIVSMSLYNWYLGKKETRFDEDNTSAPDYTVVVHNPPPDAVDPDEWRDFFDKYSTKGVTLCTVALDNEPLLRKLVQRRKDIQALTRQLPPGIECDFLDGDEGDIGRAVENARRFREGEEARRNCLSRLIGGIFTPVLRCVGLRPTETMLWNRIKAATREVRELQKREYRAAAIYVTFETEMGQRTALEALNCSEMEIMTNKPTGLDSSALFRGRVLRAEEASEPTAVRWTDLHFSRRYMYLRLVVTFGITVGLVFLSAFILQLSRLRVSTILFSVILSTSNFIIPSIVRIMGSFEKHYDEGWSQASLYLKVTLFRWVNTAIVTRVITPFLVTIGEMRIDLINTVNALMISEMILSPLLRYFDPMTILDRHIFAPRARTEEEMFGCFQGGYYNLAERFTDFTKVLLLCTFYSSFHPLIYFLGAAILFAQYWMDKFLLLRSWQRAPNIGTDTARFSRIYFNTAAILLGAISSGYAYARSPFTQLCSCAENNKECAIPETQEFTDVALITGETIPSVTASGEYYFCNQDEIGFPPVPRVQGDDKWMTDSQERLATIYGWTCFVLLILYCVFVLGGRTIRIALSLVKGVYEPTGRDQHKDFSSGIGFESFGYIPQLDTPGFHFPMLACDIDNIDVRLIGWKDPNCHHDADPHRNYDHHNLIFDVPHESLHRSRYSAANKNRSSGGEGNGRPIFSVVKHYPPEWARKAAENQQVSSS